MKEDDGGGGREGDQVNTKPNLKRKSVETGEAANKRTKSNNANDNAGGTGSGKQQQHWLVKGIKKAHRRGRHKRKKPRSVDGDHPASETRPKPTRRKRRITLTNNAPFNSTQFLMNDHITDTIRHLDDTLNKKEDPEAGNGSRRNRVKSESSFSVDSNDDDFFYSSPEDEEDFVNKEFMKDYDNVRSDRLVDMTKTELINEYLVMEKRIETLEKRLSKNRSGTETPVATAENSEKISQYQKEIQRLQVENDQLKQQSAARCCSSSCSNSSCSSSSSDNDSSSGSSSSSCSSSEDEDEVVQDGPEVTASEAAVVSTMQETLNKIIAVEENLFDDVGYESGQSLVKHNDEAAEEPVPEDLEEADAPASNQVQEVAKSLISVNSISSTSI